MLSTCLLITAPPGRAEPENDPLWLAYVGTSKAIGVAAPQTLAGMIAKAKAAKAESLDPKGTENPEDGPAAHWAWDLVGDLLRLERGDGV
jgi:hypothetical protein